MIDRRTFIRTAACGVTGAAISSALPARTQDAANPPNIILCMSDDQGWGDTGYNGHPHLKTPNLDAMARSGIRFDRWYSGAPVCSPTRGSALTGRHPFRYGVFNANAGHMREPEITLAEALKTRGYTTGHFGKWHLGTLTKSIQDGRRGGRSEKEIHYSPPWENGFDQSFSTEVQMPTWDPMVNQKFPSKYWTGPDQYATDNLEGDDSRVIMDRAIPFMREAVEARQPFFTVIWFHTPHEPVVAGPAYRKMYTDHPPDRQHYYGAITAMDEQVGRLRSELRTLGVADNTMLWFSSDNGPTNRGSAGPFRGGKTQLYEGGVRVPGILEWPAMVSEPRVVDMACSTLDYFPTVMDVLSFKMDGQPKPEDGISLVPMMKGKMNERPGPIGFESGKAVALTDNRYKLYRKKKSDASYELYDLLADPSETTNLVEIKPRIAKKMVEQLEQWRASCAESLTGADYDTHESD